MTILCKGLLEEKYQQIEDNFIYLFIRPTNHINSLNKDEKEESPYCALPVIKNGVEYFKENSKPEAAEKILDRLLEITSAIDTKICSYEKIQCLLKFIIMFFSVKYYPPQQLIEILADEEVNFLDKFLNKKYEDLYYLVNKLYKFFNINHNEELLITFNAAFVKNFILSDFSDVEKDNLGNLIQELELGNENKTIIRNLLYFGFQNENFDKFKKILSFKKDDFKLLMKDIYRVNFDNLIFFNKNLPKLNNKDKTDIDSLSKYITETHDLKNLLNRKYESVDILKFIRKFTAFKINVGFVIDGTGMSVVEVVPLLKLMKVKYSIYLQNQAKLIADELGIDHLYIPEIIISNNKLYIDRYEEILIELDDAIKHAVNNKLTHKFFYLGGNHAHMLYIKIDKTQGEQGEQKINVEIIDPNPKIKYKDKLQLIINKINDKYRYSDYHIETKMITAGIDNIDGVCVANILFEMERKIELIIKESILNEISDDKLYNLINNNIKLEKIYQETLDDIAKTKLYNAITNLNMFFNEIGVTNNEELINEAQLDYLNNFDATKYKKIYAQYLGITHNDKQYDSQDEINSVKDDIENQDENINFIDNKSAYFYIQAIEKINENQHEGQKYVVNYDVNECKKNIISNMNKNIASYYDIEKYLNEENAISLYYCTMLPNDIFISQFINPIEEIVINYEYEYE